MKKFLLTTSLVFFVGSVFAQVPVTDVVLNQQTIANQVANIAKFSEQIIQLKAQLDQAKMLYTQLNGLRNVGNLLNNQLLTQYLPPDYQQALLNIKTGIGVAAGISGNLNQIAKQYGLVDCAIKNFTASTIATCKAQQQQMAMNQYVGDQGYKQAAQNIQNLQTFVNTIQTSEDPKALQDLQARIQLEQVKIQNEQVKLQTIAMMQKAQDDIKRQNQSDSVQQMLQPSTSSNIRF